MGVCRPLLHSATTKMQARKSQHEKARKSFPVHYVYLALTNAVTGVH